MSEEPTIQFDPKILTEMAEAAMHAFHEAAEITGLHKATKDSTIVRGQCWREAVAAAWMKKRELEAAKSLKGGI